MDRCTAATTVVAGTNISYGISTGSTTAATTGATNISWWGR